MIGKATASRISVSSLLGGAASARQVPATPATSLLPAPAKAPDAMIEDDGAGEGGDEADFEVVHAGEIPGAKARPPPPPTAVPSLESVASSLVSPGHPPAAAAAAATTASTRPVSVIPPITAAGVATPVTRSPVRRQTVKLMPAHGLPSANPELNDKAGTQGFWGCQGCKTLNDTAYHPANCRQCNKLRGSEWTCGKCQHRNGATENFCGGCGNGKFVYAADKAGREKQAEGYIPEAQAESDAPGARHQSLPTMPTPAVSATDAARLRQLNALASSKSSSAAETSAAPMNTAADVRASPLKRPRADEPPQPAGVAPASSSSAAAAATVPPPPPYAPATEVKQPAVTDFDAIFGDGADLALAARRKEDDDRREIELARCNEPLKKGPMWFENFRTHPTDPTQRDLEFCWREDKKKERHLAIRITKTLPIPANAPAGFKPIPDDRYNPKKKFILTLFFALLGGLTDAWPFGNFKGSTKIPSKNADHLASDPKKAKLTFMAQFIAWHDALAINVGKQTGFDRLGVVLRSWCYGLDLQYCYFAVVQVPKAIDYYNTMATTLAETIALTNEARLAKNLPALTPAEVHDKITLRVHQVNQHHLVAGEYPDRETNDSMFISDYAFTSFPIAGTSIAEGTEKDPMIMALVAKKRFVNMKPLYDGMGNVIPWADRWRIGQGAVVSFKVSIGEYVNLTANSKFGIMFTYESGQLIDEGRVPKVTGVTEKIPGARPFVASARPLIYSAPTLMIANSYAFNIRRAGTKYISEPKAKFDIAATVPTELKTGVAMITDGSEQQSGAEKAQPPPGFSAAAAAASNRIAAPPLPPARSAAAPTNSGANIEAMD